MWSNLSQKSNLLLSPLQSLFVLSLLPIALWLIVVDVAQYLLTEHWYVFNYLNTNYTTTVLIVLILVTSLLPIERMRLGRAVLVVGLFGLVLYGHMEYSRFYGELQQVPKIKSISKDWSIQGDRITIEGRNFGEPYEPGEVRVGEVVFGNQSWTDTKVVVEQPVPDEFFEASLQLTNKYGNSIEVIERFTIKDPTEISQ